MQAPQVSISFILVTSYGFTIIIMSTLKIIVFSVQKSTTNAISSQPRLCLLWETRYKKLEENLILGKRFLRWKCDTKDLEKLLHLLKKYRSRKYDKKFGTLSTVLPAGDNFRGWFLFHFQVHSLLFSPQNFNNIFSDLTYQWPYKFNKPQWPYPGLSDRFFFLRYFTPVRKWPYHGLTDRFFFKHGLWDCGMVTYV